MNIIKWKRERIKNFLFEDILLEIENAVKFEFTCLDKQGTLILKNNFYWKKGLAGFATIDNHKWVLKVEKEPFAIKIKLFDFDIGEYVTRFRGDEFILKTGTYWIKIGKRYFLNLNGGKKLKLTVFNSQQKIFTAWAEYDTKRFFNNIYDSSISGEIEYENEPNWELIFSAFITFFISLKSDQESSA